MTMMHVVRSRMAAAGCWVRSAEPERAHLRAGILPGTVTLEGGLMPGAVSSQPDPGNFVSLANVR
jgi:hypothetical protein